MLTPPASAGAAGGSPCPDVQDGGGILAAPTCDALRTALDGERKTWYPDGALRHEAVIVEGLRHGPARWRYLDGTDAAQGEYVQGRRQGVWTFWAPDGAREREGAYDHGVPVGVWRRWVDGEALEPLTFEAGLVSGCCPAGTTPSRVGHDVLYEERTAEPAPQDRSWGYATFCLDGEGRRHGPFFDWASDGQLHMEGAYSRGVPHGRWRVWSEVTAWEEQRWVNGLRQGRWEKKEHGVTVASYGFAGGERQGWQREWYLDGQLSFEVRYVRGVPHGTLESWHVNGVPAIAGLFEHGTRVGMWVAWLPNGQMRRRGFYRQGIRDGSWAYWYDNGSLYLAGAYRGGLKEGEWGFWYPDGRLGREGVCKAGEGSGIWREWEVDGAMRREGTYEALSADAWAEIAPCGELPLIETVDDGTPWSF